MKGRNLFEGWVEVMDEEVFETLIQTETFRLERILSKGHATPPETWYDQEKDEWVLLLKGSAGLFFEGETEIRTLAPGDFLHIPSHRRHRVEWTDPEETTVWLALHYSSSEGTQR